MPKKPIDSSDQAPPPRYYAPGRRLNTVDQVRAELCKVYRAMVRRVLPSADGARMADVLFKAGRLIEASDLEKRLEALEVQEEGSNG